MKRKEEQTNFTQMDVDLMMWNHCNGMMTLLNSLNIFGSMIGVDQANDLARQKFEALEKTFSITPSFRIEFSYQNERYEIKKIML
jgi:hypothetical protein